MAFSLAALLGAGLPGCVIGGPKPEDFADMTRALPPVPLCRHRYEGPTAGGRPRGVVSCEGDARVGGAELRGAALAEARSMSAAGRFTILREWTSPLDRYNVQCEIVPIVPWEPRGLVDLRWKTRRCSLTPAGPPGHSLQLAVQFDRAGG